MLTQEEVLKLIESGESVTVEFKSWEKAHSKKDLLNHITKEAVALANTKGGYIFVGVEDSGEISGCPEVDIQNIIETIYDKTRPPMFTDIQMIHLNDKKVLIISVDKSPTLQTTTSGEVYKRLGKNSKPMYPDEYAMKQIGKTHFDFSNTVIEQSSEEDINYLEVYKLKEKLKAREAESTLVTLNENAFLKDLELIKEVDGKIKLTVAGALFVAKESSIKSYLPQAEIIYLHYSEKNETEYDKRLDLRMPIIAALDRLTEKIEDFNTITNIQVGLFRIEVKDFPTNVFQEALLNAISHRDYTSNGAIYVKHYSDRLIIENPGSFPEGIDEKNIITHPSIPRNKLIAETLQKLKYVQRSGQGVDIIFRDMISLGKPIPKYHLFGDAVSLVLRSTLEDEGFVKFVIQEQDKNSQLFGTLEMLILYHLKNSRSITYKEALEITQGFEEDVKSILNHLVSMGYLERNAKKYMLTQKVYEALGDSTSYVKDKTIEYIRAKSMILEYLEQKGQITRKVTQELCGYNEEKAKYLLKKLCGEKIIVLHRKGKDSYYVKA